MSLRRCALEALMDITDKGAYANLRLKELDTDERDKKFITALVYETLEHLYFIDYQLAHLTKGALKPAIRGILRLGACEILFMHTPGYTACNEAVKLVKEIGKGALSGFINGVLRSLVRNKAHLPVLPEEPVKRLSIEYSWPEFIVREWLNRFGEESCTALLSSSAPRMQLRAQPPYSVQDVETLLKARGIPYHYGVYDPNCVIAESGLDIAQEPLFLDGVITVQSESAMLVCRACDAHNGVRVMDACAAPGGKSAYLYALSNGNIDLHAFELHEHRVALIKKTFARLHVKADTVQQDVSNHIEKQDAAFDCVLLDVPCSGFGVEKADLRYSKTEEDIKALVKTQAEILETCCRYVKPGGTLVYATCTISKRENEEQIAQFLKRHKEFMLTSMRGLLALGVPGAETGMVQLMKTDNGMDGFFIAHMQRQAVTA